MSGFFDLLNFRDFGSYAAADGQVRPGLLFRSAAPHDICAADLERLGGLGVSAIVDLRRWSEREAAPAQRWSGFAAQVVESAEQDVAIAPHERFLAGPDLSPQVLRGRMTDYYRNAPFDPRLVALFRRAFEVIAEADGAVHVHCAVGKDRTGILVALIQHALGVSEADQIREYLLTAEEQRLVTWLTERAIGAAERLGGQLDRNAAEVITSVDARYLAAARGAIFERCGSIEAYLAEIGIGENVLDRLRGRLLG